jgi:hypothetical protein
MSSPPDEERKRKDHPISLPITESELKIPKMSPRVLHEMTKEEISLYFHLPIAIACIPLNAEVEMLTKRCRELGIKRWPYNARKEKKSNVQSTDEGRFFSEFQVTKPTISPIIRKPERLSPRQDGPAMQTLPEKLPSFSELMGNINDNPPEQHEEK